MSMKAYFERLQQEYNVTCVEFVADQAKGEGRISRQSFPIVQSSRRNALNAQSERPSFHSHSERLSSAPKPPSRRSSCERLVTLETAIALLNDLSPEYQPSCEDNEGKPSSSLTHHIRTSRAA